VSELARARSIPLYQAAREIAETEELTGRARKALADLVAAFERWRGQIDGMKHTELADMILDESGYTQMWQNDKSPQAHSRLENLKELIRFMHEFESLQGFLEHVSLVMDADKQDGDDRISLMTLHGAKGLEFGVVFLPGWEEGLFPHQRSLDDNGQAAWRERRLAYGASRARRQAKVSFAQNRRNRGLWRAASPRASSTSCPANVEVIERRAPTAALAAVRRWLRLAASTTAPAPERLHHTGWQRAKRTSPGPRAARRAPVTLEGEPSLPPPAYRTRWASACSTRNSATARWPGRRRQAHHRFRQAAKTASSTTSWRGPAV
jgi:DNA helicase-2/ATP-dependent DNA helicase PcrA